MRPRSLRPVLLEPLEDRVLLAATVGSLDVVSTWPNGMPFQVAGWAFDADVGPAGAGPVQVRLDVDGFPTTTLQATVARPDIVSTVGSPNHGYVFTLNPLAPGTHTLRVVATDQPFGTEVVLGQRTVTVQPGALGVVDSFDPARGISGWAFDPVLPSAAVAVRLDIDGKPAATQNTTIARPDLLPFFGTANHGFNLAVPTLTQGPHQISVFALSLTGAPTLLGTFAATPPGPPFGNLEVADQNIIGGWVVDPDNTSTGVTVRIDIDGIPVRSLTTSIQRPDLARFGTGAFGFQVNTPLLGPGNHTIQVFAIDNPTGNPVLLGQRNLTLAPRVPIGNVDVLTAKQVAGWALDPDSANQPVQFRIDVDAVTVLTAAAAIERPDLGPIFGTTAHGFSASLGNLSPGSHLVEVFAIDLQTGTPTLLRSSTVSVA